MANLFETYLQMKEGTQQMGGSTAMPNMAPEGGGVVKETSKKICSDCGQSKCACVVKEDNETKAAPEAPEVPFEPPYTTVKNNKKNGMNKARELARKSLAKAFDNHTAEPDNLKKHHFGMAESNDIYDRAEDHRVKAEMSKGEGDMGAYHHHMVNHHELKGHWHASKGRHDAAEKEYDKAEHHHNESMKHPLKEAKSAQEKLYARHMELRKKAGLPHPDYYKDLSKTYDIEDHEERHKAQKEVDKKYGIKEAHKIGDKVIIHKGPADLVGKVGHIGEIRKRWTGDSNTYTIDHDKGSVQLKPTHFKSFKEEAEINESAPFKDLHSAIKYASDKVKTHRDHDDGIEVYKHKAGGYDVNHTMNSNGRNSLQKSGAKHLGTVYRDKQFNVKHNIKEEIEMELTEANHREFASVGKMHPDMAKHMEVGQHMDYYEPKTGNKVHGKVMHKTDKEVHMKQTHDSYDDKKVGSVHKFKIAHSLDEVLSPSADAGEYIDDFVHSKNPKFAGKSKEKRRQMALAAFYAAKKKNESVTEESKAKPRVVTNKYSWGTMKTVHHGSDFSIPLHPEHHEAIAKLKDGQEHHFKDETGHHWGAYRRGEHVHFQSADHHGAMKTTVPHHTMVSEAKEDNKYDPDHGAMIKHQLASIISNAQKLHDMIEDEGDKVQVPDWVESKITLAQDYIETAHDFLDNATEEDLEESWVLRQKKKDKKEESKKTVKESTVKTYRDFINEMEFDKHGKYVHKGTYGSSYQDDEDDEDDKPKAKPADAPKRGRGRPAGSKSGAAGKTSQSTGKKSSGADYTGYKLHLPNSNK